MVRVQPVPCLPPTQEPTRDEFSSRVSPQMPSICNCFLLHLFQTTVFNIPREGHAKVLNTLELEQRGTDRLWRFDTEEVSPLHIVQVKDRPHIRLAPGKLNVRQLDIVHI